jgi:hypothetical protein
MLAFTQCRDSSNLRIKLSAKQFTNRWINDQPKANVSVTELSPLGFGTQKSANWLNNWIDRTSLLKQKMAVAQ